MRILIRGAGLIASHLADALHRDAAASAVTNSQSDSRRRPNASSTGLLRVRWRVGHIYPPQTMLSAQAGPRTPDDIPVTKPE